MNQYKSMTVPTGMSGDNPPLISTPGNFELVQVCR